MPSLAEAEPCSRVDQDPNDQLPWQQKLKTGEHDLSFMKSRPTWMGGPGLNGAQWAARAGSVKRRRFLLFLTFFFFFFFGFQKLFLSAR